MLVPWKLISPLDLLAIGVAAYYVLQWRTVAPRRPEGIEPVDRAALSRSRRIDLRSMALAIGASLGKAALSPLWLLAAPRVGVGARGTLRGSMAVDIAWVLLLGVAMLGRRRARQLADEARRGLGSGGD